MNFWAIIIQICDYLFPLETNTALHDGQKKALDTLEAEELEASNDRLRSQTMGTTNRFMYF